MRRIALVVALAACGHGQMPIDDTAEDAPGDQTICTMQFEREIDRSCTVPSDCVLEPHGKDCCGDTLVGIHAGTEGSFPSIEMMYQTCLACPPVGCAHADEAEDGQIPTMGQSIVADCVANRCTSVVR
jgi:hypothetical protein